MSSSGIEVASDMAPMSSQHLGSNEDKAAKSLAKPLAPEKITKKPAPFVSGN
jgi:hypothetical protein